MSYANGISLVLLFGMMGAAGCGTARTITVDPTAAKAADVYGDIAGAVAALREGDRLVIRPGVYREAIDLRGKKWEGKERTVIEGDPHGQTAIKGSRSVPSWKKVGPDFYVHADWDVPSQELFVDGRPLAQVGGELYGGFPTDPDHPLHAVRKSGSIWPGRRAGDARNMPAESFYYDATERALYLRTTADPNAAEIEASTEPFLLYSEVDMLSVRDLVFLHSNTTATGRGGAVTLKGSGIEVERIAVWYADGVGILLNGEDIRLQDSAICYSGQLGLAARGRGMQLLGNETSYNNTRGFEIRWEAGGAKFIGQGGLRDSVIARHRALYNEGHGLWFDTENPGNAVCDSALAYNEGHGLEFEMSGPGLVSRNLVLGNDRRGVYLSGAHDVAILDNAVIGNGWEGVAVAGIGDDPDARAADRAATGNSLFGNLIAWNAREGQRRDLVLPAGGAGVRADGNLYVAAARPEFSPAWGDAPASGLEAWRRLSGNDLHAQERTAAMPPELKDPRLGGRSVARVLGDAVDEQWNAARRASGDRAHEGVPAACAAAAAEPWWLESEEVLASRCSEPWRPGAQAQGAR